MRFSVMITTRDRWHDLERTCKRLLVLSPPPDEVLICTDGCTDATVQLVREGFPTFRLLENSRPKGSVASRHRLLRMATGEVIVSLDDDSYPVADDFLARLGQTFEEHPEAAVIAFPELRDGESCATNSRAESPPGHFAAAYANCAAAMRRQFYLEQPGFPPFFEHMYEEPDYALQCYGSGAAVWVEPSLVIRHHLSSANRQPIRRHHQNARNEIWSVWLRCPWPQLLAVSLFRVWRQLRYAWSEGLIWAIREPLWWFQTLPGSFQCLRARRPIAWPIYYQWMRLARNPIPSIWELKRAFPGTKGE